MSFIDGIFDATLRAHGVDVDAINRERELQTAMKYKQTVKASFWGTSITFVERENPLTRDEALKRI